ncbi:membrane protein [Caballeronia pedi]|uniref:Membrane protein n=1 Tax=Caballeronia pedi TaxID=1777141 RepID=A0A158DWA2_9BURK|nr:AI-2E family transporter [Caballeronia pedi]SAK98813.1 membrane protein [Caballeronia pedi]
MTEDTVHKKFFYLLLAVVTGALVWILLPFFGAVFWGTILAIIFQPMQRYLAARLGKSRNLAALTTLLGTILIVILPLSVLAATMVQEIALAYTQLKAAQPHMTEYLQHAVHALPSWMQAALGKFGLTDIAGIQKRLTDGAAAISQFAAAQAVSIGQNTFDFVISFGVMLYLVFFLLRDGGEIGRRIRRALPLESHHKEHLISKFNTVVRATVKGNIAVAAVQGVLGGLIFMFLGIQGALLWGVLMAFLSLLPAIGASIVWAPAAVYFLVTGAITKGVILVLFCVVVIGLVDNLLRPLLVGKDVGMPDWCVLISTLGGMAVFGINGFVIGPLIAALFMSAWEIYAREDETAE